jgi:hypothetical protein
MRGLMQHGYRGWLTIEYDGADLEHVFQPPRG